MFKKITRQKAASRAVSNRETIQSRWNIVRAAAFPTGRFDFRSAALSGFHFDPGDRRYMLGVP
jgi:hypothetical protein